MKWAYLFRVIVNSAFKNQLQIRSNLFLILRPTRTFEEINVGPKRPTNLAA